MKKLKVLLSALAMVAAMALVSCGGGAGDDPTGGKSGSGAVKLCKVEISQKYGSVATAVPSDAKAIKYVFVRKPENVQFIYQDSVVNTAITDYTAYYSAYMPIESAEVTVNLAEALEQLKTQDNGNPDATGVAKICLQNTADGANSFEISSITIIKEDDSEVSAGLPATDGYSSTVTAL